MFECVDRYTCWRGRERFLALLGRRPEINGALIAKSNLAPRSLFLNTLLKGNEVHKLPVLQLFQGKHKRSLKHLSAPENKEALKKY